MNRRDLVLGSCFIAGVLASLTAIAVSAPPPARNRTSERTPVIVLVYVTPTRTPQPPVSPAASHRWYVTEAELRAALQRSPWPDRLHEAVIARTFCEAPAVDGIRVLGVDPEIENGDHIGVLQVARSQHPNLVRSFDLADLHDGLTAAYVIYLEAGGSFWPWSCLGERSPP